MIPVDDHESKWAVLRAKTKRSKMNGFEQKTGRFKKENWTVF